MNMKKYTYQVETGIIWLQKQKRYGYYGNTNSNLMVLKALIQYDKIVENKNKKLKKVKCSIKIDDNEFVVPIDLASEHDLIQSEDLSKFLKPGDHTVKLSLSDGSVPFTFNTSFSSKKPSTSENCILKMETKISNDTFSEGDGGEIFVNLKNNSNLEQNMSVCIIGLPSGIEPRFEQLQELIKGETIDSYEIMERDLVIYKNNLNKNEELKFKIDIIAKYPGIYKGRSSRAYYYYENENKKWIDGLKCEIN